MMMQLFNNKYRIPSARLKNWDYANEAMYFVTICTKDRVHYFGAIANALLQPTEIGKMAHTEWYKTLSLRPDMNLELGEFVVMPNHIHGIIMIGANEYNSNKHDDSRAAMHGGPTKINPNIYKNRFGPQSKNLSSIIRGYKSAVTTWAQKNYISFERQTRFHDHIIRSMEEYQRIAHYIINNPAIWQEKKLLKTIRNK